MHCSIMENLALMEQNPLRNIKGLSLILMMREALPHKQQHHHHHATAELLWNSEYSN